MSNTPQKWANFIFVARTHRSRYQSQPTEWSSKAAPSKTFHQIFQTKCTKFFFWLEFMDFQSKHFFFCAVCMMTVSKWIGCDDWRKPNANDDDNEECVRKYPPIDVYEKKKRNNCCFYSLCLPNGIDGILNEMRIIRIQFCFSSKFQFGTYLSQKENIVCFIRAEQWLSHWQISPGSSQ